MYERGKAYFLSVWRGQLSLALTFWLWWFLVVGILVNVCGVFLAQFVADMLETDEPYVWYFAAIIIGTVWTNVGLWRSAARTGGVWSVLARVLVVIALLGVIALIVWFILQIIQQA
jgi:hypothetical protein